MKKISATDAFTLRAGPILFVVFLIVYAALGLMNGNLKQAPMFVIGPILMGVAGCMFWKMMYQDVAEEVYDGGDHLLVRKNGQEDTVLLTNIINVSFTMTNRGSSGRITLTLDKPGKFGSEIIFIPPVQFSFFSTPENKIANDLIARTVALRTKRVA